MCRLLTKALEHATSFHKGTVADDALPATLVDMSQVPFGLAGASPSFPPMSWAHELQHQVHTFLLRACVEGSTRNWGTQHRGRVGGEF